MNTTFIFGIILLLLTLGSYIEFRYISHVQKQQIMTHEKSIQTPKPSTTSAQMHVLDGTK